MRSLWLKRTAGVALALGLLMSLLALDSDLLRTAGVRLAAKRSEQSHARLENGHRRRGKIALGSGSEIGRKIILDCGRPRPRVRDFILSARQTPGRPGPSARLPGRVAGFGEPIFLSGRVTTNSSMPDAETVRQEGDVYTEEGGMNPFVGRSALFIRDGSNGAVPHNIRVGFQSVELIATMETRPLRRTHPHLAGFSLPQLSNAAAMTSPAISVVVPVFNEEENMSILQAELRAALTGLDYEIIFVDDGSSDGTAEKIENAPQVRVIRFEKNTGQSAAMYAGLKRRARRNGGFDRRRSAERSGRYSKTCSPKFRAAPIWFAVIAQNAKTRW